MDTGVAFAKIKVTADGDSSVQLSDEDMAIDLMDATPHVLLLQAVVGGADIPFSITFDQLVAGDTTMEAVYPNSLLLAGAGSENPCGFNQAEADTFEWESRRWHGRGGDTILGFKEGTDAIDLSDLLTGYDSADNLTDFISVTTETVGGQTNTIISINSDGEGEDTGSEDRG